MLLEAVDNFQPGWTREDCVAMRSIRLRHTRFLISVTLLEDEDEIGAFYLIRSSAGTSPPPSNCPSVIRIDMYLT